MSQIKASAMPNLPLFWTEWNVAGHERIARHHLRWGQPWPTRFGECDGDVSLMSFWTFSDVFEEGGPLSETFRRVISVYAPREVSTSRAITALPCCTNWATGAWRIYRSNVIVTTDGKRPPD